MSNNKEILNNKSNTKNRIKRTTAKTPDKFVISDYKSSFEDKKKIKNQSNIQKKTSAIKSKKLSISSKDWLLRQLNDPLVQKAKDMGYRSRACFKLIEINNKYSVIKNAKTILDLGCAPGSWTEVCKKLNSNARIVACDLLKIDPIVNVEFICGDFSNEDIQNQILSKANLFDVIVSDIAPNTTGDFESDHIKIINICEEVFYFAKKFLKQNGNLVIKIFMGSKEKEFVLILKNYFSKVSYFKPKSSRTESKEIYLVCLNYLKN